MRTIDVENFCNNKLFVKLASVVDPRLLRREPEVEIFRGLNQVLRHALRVNNASRSWHHHGQHEHNPIGLRDRDGNQITVVSDFVPTVNGGMTRFVKFIAADGCSACVEALERKELPDAFDPAAPAAGVDFRHIWQDHPERFNGLGEQGVKARLKAAHAEGLAAIASGAAQAASYWYPRDQRWCHVIPLRLERSGEPIAGVLVPQDAGYFLVTVLPLHETWWNVASTGAVPPAWLNPIAPMPYLAA